jgi:hypothetical protein
MTFSRKDEENHENSIRIAEVRSVFLLNARQIFLFYTMYVDVYISHQTLQMSLVFRGTSISLN